MIHKKKLVGNHQGSVNKCQDNYEHKGYYKKYRKKFRVLFIILIVCILIQNIHIAISARASGKVYKITTSTKPCDSSAKYTTYNKYTKHYYTLLSFLKKLEEEGGGTLELSKGTYTITNTLYVPSNVTIKLKDGVKIVKGKKSGTSKFTASKSIFQFCGYSKSSKKGVYKKYDGESNISLIGEGAVSIDMNYDEDAVGIMMCHNRNIKITGITFQNMYSGHFIEMDASKNVIVKNCTFKNHKDSYNNNKEAINLDTPDKSTNGFHADWSSYDKTANENVIISNCTFKNLERSIGTHKYSQNELHTNVQILNNTITNCDQDAIRIMNWEEPIIKGNTITNVGNKKIGLRGILISGVINPQISDNVFKSVSRPIQIMPWKNIGDGDEYDIIYSSISDACIEIMKNNVLIDGDEYFVRYSKEYNEYKKNTEKIPLKP